MDKFPSPSSFAINCIMELPIRYYGKALHRKISGLWAAIRIHFRRADTGCVQPLFPSPQSPNTCTPFLSLALQQRMNPFFWKTDSLVEICYHHLPPNWSVRNGFLHTCISRTWGRVLVFSFTWVNLFPLLWPLAEYGIFGQASKNSRFPFILFPGKQVPYWPWKGVMQEGAQGSLCRLKKVCLSQLKQNSTKSCIQFIVKLSEIGLISIPK